MILTSIFICSWIVSLLPLFMKWILLLKFEHLVSLDPSWDSVLKGMEQRSGHLAVGDTLLILFCLVPK